MSLFTALAFMMGTWLPEAIAEPQGQLAEKTAVATIAAQTIADAQPEGTAQPQDTSPPVIEAVDLTTPPAVSSTPEAGENNIIPEANRAPQELVFEGKSDEDVIETFVEYMEAIDTLQGTFYQQAPSGNLSTGKFFIRRPGLLRFEYDPPTPLLIIANGGTVFVRDEALKTTDSYPVGRTPLKFLLRKKIDLSKANITSVERGTDAAAITLSARDDETEGELTLFFSAPEVQLIRWVVRDARNGLTIVDLADVVQDEKLKNSLFRIPETKSPFLKN